MIAAIAELQPLNTSLHLWLSGADFDLLPCVGVHIFNDSVDRHQQPNSVAEDVTLCSSSAMLVLTRTNRGKNPPLFAVSDLCQCAVGLQLL